MNELDKKMLFDEIYLDLEEIKIKARRLLELLDAKDSLEELIVKLNKSILILESAEYYSNNH